MYKYVLFNFLYVARGVCFSNYELFRGFDNDVKKADINTTTDYTTKSTKSYQQNELEHFILNKTSNITDKATTLSYTNTSTEIKYKKKKIYATCFEERPSNIGSYEVPTRKDMLIFTRDLLLDMFDTYKRDAMTLLRDMKEVTKATASIEKKCNDKKAYRECVKLVSGQSEVVTKSLVASIEMEKLDIKDITENTTCSLSDLKKDPISLIKLMVQETVMLKFALPGFLRFLNSCLTYCKKDQVLAHKKPLRYMKDQDLVVKYFLTKKNYRQLIKDSRRAV